MKGVYDLGRVDKRKRGGTRTPKRTNPPRRAGRPNWKKTNIPGTVEIAAKGCVDSKNYNRGVGRNPTPIEKRVDAQKKPSVARRSAG